jgi:DMSO/TMAO reductase YedYZ molybdopterin-dependent catalytic subunit
MSLAQNAETGLAVGGDVRQPLVYSLEELAGLPHVSMPCRSGGAAATCSGVSFYELLKRAGAPLDEELMGRAVASYVVAHGRDGFQAVFALAEIDPGISDNRVLAVDKIDGKPLDSTQGPLRLVTSQDKRASRSVRTLIRIELVRLRK